MQLRRRFFRISTPEFEEDGVWEETNALDMVHMAE